MIAGCEYQEHIDRRSSISMLNLLVPWMWKLLNNTFLCDSFGRACSPSVTKIGILMPMKGWEPRVYRTCLVMTLRKKMPLRTKMRVLGWDMARVWAVQSGMQRLRDEPRSETSTKTGCEAAFSLDSGCFCGWRASKRNCSLSSCFGCFIMLSFPLLTCLTLTDIVYRRSH